jgi:hypothetical protein
VYRRGDTNLSLIEIISVSVPKRWTLSLAAQLLEGLVSSSNTRAICAYLHK